jgi:hypothetical protein
MPRDFKVRPTLNGADLALRTEDTVVALWSFAGASTVQTGKLRWYNDLGVSLTIIACRVSANTAPTGATLIADFNKNGTTVFTTQGNRPAIAISGNTDKKTNMDVVTVADGDYLTVDIDQIGSTVAGADVVCEMMLRRT